MSKNQPLTNPVPPTEQQILSVLLEVTGDLDTAQALQKSLPAGLLKASVGSLEAMDKTARDLHARQAVVERALRRLKPLNNFCIEELKTALADKWTAVFDVEKDHLELPGEACGCEPTTTATSKIPVIAPATRSLLEAAMQNFTEEETQDDGFPAGSVVRIASTPAGVDGLTPAAFAVFCRELDLGKRYQEHFQQAFGLTEVGGTVVATSRVTQDIASLKKLQLQLDLHLALMKNHVTRSGFDTVQRLIDADGVAGPTSLRRADVPLVMQGIELLDACIWSVVVFSERSVELYPDDGCMVYMPGEPRQTLYEYPSFKAFLAYLEFELGGKSYQAYFAQCLDEEDRADFFKRFTDSRSLGHARQLPIAGSLFEFMVKSHVGKHQIDARCLAVPTADVDEETRKQRLLGYLEAGLTLATIAGLFVPVLGQLMMGVAAGQLLAEIYEGVEDWNRGDRQEAFTHLLSVVENIGLMVVAGIGQHALKSLVLRTIRRNPEFFGQFTAILGRDDQSLLWKPELARYEHAFPAGAALTPDALGLYRIDGKIFIRLDSGVYEVAHEPLSQRWHIQHPDRPSAYAPPLARNPQGGWRHAAERAEQWPAGYTLKRIDPRLADFEDSHLDMSRRLSDMPLDELHRLSDHNLPLPARMNDTLERFALKRRVADFISAMERAEPTGTRHVPEQLHALPRLPGWPSGRSIKVVDTQGRITAMYPPASLDVDSLDLTVSDAQLDSGELLQTVIDGLSAQQVQALLGASVAPAEQATQLAKKLGAAVKADRRSMFDELYRQYDRSATVDVMKVRSEFPQLPARYVQRLISRAPSVDRQLMRANGRAPMGLAQELREAACGVRLDRALSGFHSPLLATADTEKLAMQMLPHLSGWDADLQLELREQSLKGRLLESIGAQADTLGTPCRLVRLDRGYEAFGSDGKSLGPTDTGPDSLYDAILKVLSAPQRKALGFAQASLEDGASLRSKLLQCSLDDREAAAQVLASGKSMPTLPEAACMPADAAAPTVPHARALMRKVRQLYPGFTDVQARTFLDGLGEDHLTRAIRVRQLQRDLEQLCDALDIWTADEPGMKAAGGVLSEIRNSRQTAAYVIEDCFRRRTLAADELGNPQFALNLDGMRVGQLPVLPAGVYFDHVQQLSLRNMDQGDELAYFLKAFRQVESVDLDRNRLTRLPEMLSHMPALEHLRLPGNQIQLTDQTLLKLGNLRKLRTLNLNDNPLGVTADVSHMTNLRFLSARDTRATQLPNGLQWLLKLERVDLRNNDIQELPVWLFKMPRQLTQTLNLRHNPLSAASSTLLKDYVAREGSGMGYVDDDIARLDERQARLNWLPETVGETGARRLRVWKALKDDPAAEGLFHLLAELGNTADSNAVRSDLTRRVWTVVEAVERDAQLRGQLLDLAASPINCTDSAAVNFSNLEIAVEVDRVTRMTKAQRVQAAPLLKLARGLFQLEQIDGIAAQAAAKDLSLDSLELSLAYRIGLAQHFDLPGQPRHMSLPSLGKVSATDLETARLRIIAAEHSPQWLKFLLSQPFWSNYLQREYQRQFSENSESYEVLMDELFDKRTELNDAEYVKQSNSISARRTTSLNALLEELTQSALRNVNLGLCESPAA